MEDIDPYVARKQYVKYADALLQQIPGEHQAHMQEWNRWAKSHSPPLQGYPNPAWQKAHPEELIGVVDGKPPVEGDVEIVQPDLPGLRGGAESAVVSISRNADVNDALTETSSLGLPPVGPVQAHENTLKHWAVMGGMFLYVSG